MCRARVPPEEILERANLILTRHLYRAFDDPHLVDLQQARVALQVLEGQAPRAARGCASPW
jgi:hypothetical protein